MAATRERCCMQPERRVGRRPWAAVLLVLLAGCGGPAPPAGTGARDVVQGYCDAIVRREGRQAYAALHPDSRKHCTAEQFAWLSDAYRRQLGFEPSQARVRSCEEHATEAIAHVVLTGRGQHRRSQYKDGLVLR